MKKARFLSALLALVFTALSFSGCHQPTLDADEIIAKTDSHVVYRSGDFCYMEFFEDYTEHYDPLCQMTFDKEYESLEHLRKTILENKFSEYDIGLMQYHCDDGVVRIFDIDKMSAPLYPEDVYEDSLWWSSSHYYFDLKSKDKNAYIRMFFVANGNADNMRPNTEQELKEDLLGEDEAFITPVFDSVESRQYQRESSESVGYSSIYVFYTVTDGSRTVEVEEIHRIAEGENYTSDHTPDCITLFISENGAYCKVVIENLSSRPTEEWLLSFGMEQYIPENAE